MRNNFEVVVVSSDLQRRLQLAEILTKLGLDPICASTLRECNESLSQRNVGLVFCDAHISDGDCQDLLNGHADRKPRVVLTSRSEDRDEFSSAMHQGAFYVISTPYRPTDVEWMVIQAKRASQKTASASLQYA